MWSQTCSEVKEIHSQYKMTAIVEVFGKSPQAYYKSLRVSNRKAADSELILHHVREQRMLMPRLGGRKLFEKIKPVLEQESIKIGRDKFFELLRANDLLIKRKRRGKRTTYSNHPFYKYSNLIKEIEVRKPEMVWVSDITYIPWNGSHAYLSLITDLYSKKIVGFKLHHNLSTEGPFEALRMAVKQRKYPENQLIHHSDRGIQYCSYAYTNYLKEKDIQISMAEAGNPYENAVAERVNGILKQEFMLDMILASSFKELEKVVKQAVWIYNNHRPHSSCNYLTPVEAYECSGTMKKRW